MKNSTIGNALKFLERTDLKGGEAQAFMEVQRELVELHHQQAEAEKAASQPVEVPDSVPAGNSDEGRG